MHLVLYAYSSDPHFNGDCDYAVVELTPTLVRQIRRRVALARRVIRQESDLFELYFSGGTAAFCDDRLIAACEAVLMAAEGEESWREELDQNGHARLPSGVALPSQAIQPTEFDRMIVRYSPSSKSPDFEIAWTAVPKQADVDVTTSGLPCTVLERYLAEATSATG